MFSTISSYISNFIWSWLFFPGLIVCAGALIPALVGGKFKRWIGFFIGGLYIVYLVIMFVYFGA